MYYLEPSQTLTFADIPSSAGSSQTVTVPVSLEQLAVWTVKNTWAIEPGQFLIKVGTSDQTFLSTNLTVS